MALGLLHRLDHRRRPQPVNDRELHTQPTVGRQLVPRFKGEAATRLASYSPRPSKNREVVLELPRRQLHAVLVPLLALDLDVAVEDVRPERRTSELGLSELVDRL